MYRRISKELQKKEYLHRNDLNQDRHHYDYQYDFHHEKI